MVSIEDIENELEKLKIVLQADKNQTKDFSVVVRSKRRYSVIDDGDIEKIGSELGDIANELRNLKHETLAKRIEEINILADAMFDVKQEGFEFEIISVFDDTLLKHFRLDEDVIDKGGYDIAFFETKIE